MGQKPLRILTAVGPYDGHDVSILALNEALLESDVPIEVIYQGYDVKAKNLVAAAVQEDVDAIAVSSYNGGHLQFYPAIVGMLREAGAGHIAVFGGGGATISKEDGKAIQQAGITKVYGTSFALPEIAADIGRFLLEQRTKRGLYPDIARWSGKALKGDSFAVARMLSLAEDRIRGVPLAERVQKEFLKVLNAAASSAAKVVMVTGDGGSGKSTIIDELVRRAVADQPELRIAVLSNDPTTIHEQTESAFLGDRVRMNYIYNPRVFMRSVATGKAYETLSPALRDSISVLRAAGYGLIIVETPGTGQAGVNLKQFSPDVMLYVKTKEFGTAIQLRKDQLLKDANVIVLNKADLPGAKSAYDELENIISKRKDASLHATLAKSARDPGMDLLYMDLASRLGWRSTLQPVSGEVFSFSQSTLLVPHPRRTYLADISQSVREYDRWADGQIALAREGKVDRLDELCQRLLEEWPARWEALSSQAAARLGTETHATTLNGLRVPKVALPDPKDIAESLRFLLEEGLPGMFPYVTGIHPLRPETAGETTRQFAGLRGPEETNARLRLLAQGVKRPRLSIAFDGITLYGDDCDADPSCRGKIGEGGVSVSSYEDMKAVLRDFDVRQISTSMTINGPAPVILAMYFNACIDKETERAGKALTAAESSRLRTETLSALRGTVQADILKEVIAQNECIFQPEFAVKLLGDVQQYFIDHDIGKFYSMSVSGYHMGEAGATPVQELAYTLSNGFTYVENFLSRGMQVDDVSPSLSFFFRVSHEAEWLVYGAVCRKIWAIAMRDRYRGSERSQLFKFHSQTSGRALQAEEWDTLNPLRLVYHSLMALLNNTNSLHVDSADEPMTTPGEKYVRQATMIPNYLREEAEAFVVQNLLSGSYAYRALLRETQERVLQEFERLDQFGGVQSAVDVGYQRREIAGSSRRYEHQRTRGSPERKIIGFNHHELPEGHPGKQPSVPELVRPTEDDWQRRMHTVEEFRSRHPESGEYLARLKQVALSGGNVFEELMETTRHATLGQITETLAEVGGRYRKAV